MSLGSDQKHDYPERGWQGSKPVSPAGRARRSGLLIRRVCCCLSKCHGIKCLHGRKIAVPRLCLIFRG